MQVRFLHDWTGRYQKGSIATVGEGGISSGQFVELEHRGYVKVIEEEPEQYRTAVEVTPKRKRGRPRKVKG